MKMKCIIQVLFLMLTVSVLSVNADEKTQPQSSGPLPMAVVKQPNYNFKPVAESTVITHEFIIENKGNAPLNINKVKTSCGCTTADYSKVIEPGKQGHVTIRGNTRGYGGRKFSKTITVHTDDPKNKTVKLYISGDVEAVASIEPKRVFLSGTPEDDLQSTVTIIPEKKYLFHITESSADQGIGPRISFTLKEEKDHYLLSITNLLKEPGTYRGRIVLKTDSEIVPEIFIYVNGVIREKKQKL